MRRDLGLISAVFTFFFLRYGLVFPLIPLLALDMGASSTVIGIIVGAFSVFSLFLSVPSGGLTDVIGVKRMLVLGVLCNIASAVLLLRANSIATLIAAQVMGGLAFQLHVVPSQAYVSRLADPAQRENGFGYLTFGAALGQTLGPVLGGVLAYQYGYHVTFIVALAISLVGLITLALPEVRGRGSISYSLVNDLRSARELAADSRMLAVLAFSAAMIFAASLRTSFLPVLLQERHFSETFVGLLISVFAGASTLIRPFVGRLLQVYRRRQLLATAISMAVVGVAIAPLLSSRLALILTLAIFGIGFGLTQPLSMVMVADLADPKRSGLAMGLRFTAITIANVFGPVLLGLIVDGFGLNVSFFVTATVVGLVGSYILVLKAELLPGRREEQALHAFDTDD